MAPPVLKSLGVSVVFVSVDPGAMGKEYVASGPYDSIPDDIYNMQIPNMGLAQAVVSGDFGGQEKRIPTVDSEGVVSQSKINDQTVPWPPMNW